MSLLILQLVAAGAEGTGSSSPRTFFDFLYGLGLVRRNLVVSCILGADLRPPSPVLACALLTLSAFKIKGLL